MSNPQSFHHESSIPTIVMPPSQQLKFTYICGNKVNYLLQLVGCSSCRWNSYE